MVAVTPLLMLILAGLTVWFVGGAAMAVVAGRLLARRDDPVIVAMETANLPYTPRSYAA